MPEPGSQGAAARVACKMGRRARGRAQLTCMRRACRYNELAEPWASRSVEGLSRFLAFLREEAERAAAAALEALKPVGTQVSPALAEHWR